MSTETFLAVTLEDLDHIKNLVLDILGWGVSPEYLVDRLTLPCSLYLCVRRVLGCHRTSYGGSLLRVSRSKDGSANVNGRGKSIWDDFSKQPGQALAQQNETIPDSIDVESLVTGGDDDKVYRALGVPKTIGTVHGLSPSCSFNASDTIVQEVIIPIIRFTLENKLIDLFDNMYDLIDALTFRLHAISPNTIFPVLRPHSGSGPGRELAVHEAAVIAQSPPSIRQTGNLIDADIELCSIRAQALSLLSLVELLTLFEDKGVAIQNVATSDRHVKMEEMIEQLASLLLLIEALLTHPDYSPHLAASLELTGLFRNMWFLCVLFYLTSVPRASSPLDEHVDAGANVWADNVSTSPAPAPASVLALEFDPLDNRPAASKAAEINSRHRERGRNCDLGFSQPFIGLLDPTSHTSQTIFQMCPFLFADTQSAVSSRYYKQKSEIHPVAIHSSFRGLVQQSHFRDKFAIHLCANSTLIRIVGRLHDDIFSDPNSPTGLNRGLDPSFTSISRLGQLFTSCHVLFWIPTRLQRGMEASDNVLLDKCFASAKLIIGQMIEVPTPSGLMCAAPDGHFVFVSFASAFMLKLLRPEFAQLLSRQMEDEIFELIGRLITTLQDVAIIFTANWCYLHLVHHTTSHHYSQNYSTLPRPCTSFNSISQD
ncbi:hypothetical protein F4604DRAFT_1934097 [Suillus subluteus]|nr:hypothetical protein F4604DRAFT_1934097 [Suillus subluteus]